MRKYTFSVNSTTLNKTLQCNFAAQLNYFDKMFKHLNIILFLSIIFLVTPFVGAATYYVSPAGSGTGTFSSPMAFSTAIAKALTAGDSVILRGGTYSLSTKQTISKSGSATNYLHIVSYADEIPVLDFRTQAYNSSNPGISLSGNYVHFKGLIIQGAGDNGMIITGNYNFIENCTFRWNCDSGLQLKTGSNNLIKNCDSYENFDYMTGGTSSPDYGGNADGFADKQYSNTGTNKYLGCRSWLNSDDGWDMYEKIGNAEIDSSWCYLNGPTEYDMSNHIRFKTDSAVWLYQFKNSNGKYVIKNYGNGNGFKVGGNYTANNVILRNCVSVKNKVKGFDQNNNNGTMTLYNCTGNGNNPDFGFSNSSYGALIVRNCASLNSLKTNQLAAKTVTQSNNNMQCAVSDFESIDHTQLLNPRKANGALPEIKYLHLTATSNLIDKGVDVGLPYVGNAPDLGAFENNLKTTIGEVYSDKLLKYSFSSSQKVLRIYHSTKRIRIFNSLGVALIDSNIDSELNNIDTNGWIPGVYILNIVLNEGKTITQKIQIY